MTELDELSNAIDRIWQCWRELAKTFDAEIEFHRRAIAKIDSTIERLGGTPREEVQG